MEIKTCEEYVLKVIERVTDENIALSGKVEELKWEQEQLLFNLRLIKKYCNFRVAHSELEGLDYIMVSNGDGFTPIIWENDDDYEIFKEMIFNDWTEK